MNTKKHAQSGFLDWRALISLLLCAVTSSIVAGTLLGVFRSEVRAGVLHPAAAGLTFEEHVAFQRAIEEVYWHHRIWPKERPDPKPPLGAVISQAQLETKVAEYLRNSHALEEHWQQPITTEQFQAEMDRMAQHTRQPDVLRELFDALGNDPFVIAECLARPVLAERLVSQLKNEAKVAAIDSIAKAVQVNRPYQLPVIASPSGGCIDNTWTHISITDAPSGRTYHTAVWTGSEMIVWGGSSATVPVNTGGRYDPSTDSWASTSTTSAPAARNFHTAVWTGSEMVIWGGLSQNFQALNTGGRYNPITDSWTPTSTTNAPTARYSHPAVWTGAEMIVWGGFDGATSFDTGGRYNPSTDSWTATSTINVPSARVGHRAVWTGSEMIIWGGVDASFNYTNTGGKYNPNTDSWIATSTTSAPSARADHTAVWADSESEMIVWG